jgi:hypothetical protein
MLLHRARTIASSASAVLAAVVAGPLLALGCTGSIADYSEVVVTAERGVDDNVRFALRHRDDACISTPPLTMQVDDVDDDIDGGGGDPCRAPQGRLAVALEAGRHVLTVAETTVDRGAEVEVEFTLPPKHAFDAAVVVQGKVVVLRDALDGPVDQLESSLQLDGAEPVALSANAEGNDVRVLLPDGLVDGEPVGGLFTVVATYRDQAVEDVDGVDDAELTIKDRIVVDVDVREATLLDDLLDIILG